VAELISRAGAKELLTSCFPHLDGSPAPFYERLGFVPTGDVNAQGGTILRLELPDNDDTTTDPGTETNARWVASRPPPQRAGRAHAEVPFADALWEVTAAFLSARSGTPPESQSAPGTVDGMCPHRRCGVDAELAIGHSGLPGQTLPIAPVSGARGRKWRSWRVTTTAT
jgi:hypothetical protein